MDPEDFHNFIYNLSLEVGDSDDFYEQVMDFMQVAFWMHGTIRLFQYAVERRYDSFNTFTAEPSTSGTSSAATAIVPARPQEAGQGDFSWLCLCGDEMDTEIHRLERVILEMQGRSDLSSGDIRTVRTQLDQFTAKLRAAERALVELRLVPDMSVFQPRAQSSSEIPQDPTPETKDSSKKGMKFKKGTKTQPSKTEPQQEDPKTVEQQIVEPPIEAIVDIPQTTSPTEQKISNESDSDMQLDLKKRFFAKLAVTGKNLSDQDSDEDDSNRSSSSNDESSKKPVFVIQNMPKNITGKGLKFKKGLKSATKINAPEDNIEVKPDYKTEDPQQKTEDDEINEETASKNGDTSQPIDENKDESPEADENTNTEDNIEVKPDYKTEDPQQNTEDDEINEETASHNGDTSQPIDENKDESLEANENTNTEDNIEVKSDYKTADPQQKTENDENNDETASKNGDTSQPIDENKDESPEADENTNAEDNIEVNPDYKTADPQQNTEDDEINEETASKNEDTSQQIDENKNESPKADENTNTEDNIEVNPDYKTADPQQNTEDDEINEETTPKNGHNSQPIDENKDESPEADENTNTAVEHVVKETEIAEAASDSITTISLDEIEQENVVQSQSTEEKEDMTKLDNKVSPKESTVPDNDLYDGFNKQNLIPLSPVPMLDLAQLSNDEDEEIFELMHSGKTGSSVSLPLANYSDDSSDGENLPKGAKRLLDFSDEDEEIFWFGSRRQEPETDSAEIVVYFDEEVPEKETTWYEPRHSAYLPQGEFAKAILECSEEEESSWNESQPNYGKDEAEATDSEKTQPWIGPVPRSSYLPRAPFDLPIVEYSDDEEEYSYDQSLENDNKEEVVAVGRRKANFSDEDGENVSCIGLLPAAPCKTSGSFSQAVVEYSDEEDGAWGGPRDIHTPRRGKCDDIMSDEEEEFTSFAPRQGPSYNARQAMDVIPTFGEYKASLASFHNRSNYENPMEGSSKLCVTSLAGDSDSTHDFADFEDLESSAGYDASLDGSMVISLVDSETSNAPMAYSTAEPDFEMEEALYNIKVERMRPTGAIPKRPKFMKKPRVPQ